MFKKYAIEFSILFLILAGVLVYFACLPLAKNLKEVNTEVAVQKETLAQKEDKLEGLEKIKSQWTSLRGQVATIQRALPKGPDVPGILSSAEPLVSSAGLQLQGFSIQASEVTSGQATQEGQSAVSQEGSLSSGISAVPVNFTLSGSYLSFLAFLDNLENNIRPVSVNTITISGESVDRPLSININTLFYYQQ